MSALVSRYLRKCRHFREDTRQGHRLGASWARGLVGSMAHDAELDRAATGSSSTTDVPGGGLQPRSLLFFFDQTDDPLAVCFVSRARQQRAKMPYILFVYEAVHGHGGHLPETVLSPIAGCAVAGGMSSHMSAI